MREIVEENGFIKAELENEMRIESDLHKELEVWTEDVKQMKASYEGLIQCVNRVQSVEGSFFLIASTDVLKKFSIVVLLFTDVYNKGKSEIKLLEQQLSSFRNVTRFPLKH